MYNIFLLMKLQEYNWKNLKTDKESLIESFEMMGIIWKLKISNRDLINLTAEEISQEIIKSWLVDELMWDSTLDFLKKYICSEISYNVLLILEEKSLKIEKKEESEKDIKFRNIQELLSKVYSYNISKDSKINVEFLWIKFTWEEFYIYFWNYFFWIDKIDSEWKYKIIFNTLLKEIKSWNIKSVYELYLRFWVLENDYWVNLLSYDEVNDYVLSFINNWTKWFNKFVEFLSEIRDENFTSSRYKFYIKWKNWKKADWLVFISQFYRKLLDQIEINITISEINQILLKVKNKEINSFDNLKREFKKQKNIEVKTFNDSLVKLKSELDWFNKFKSLLLKIDDDLFLNNSWKKIEFDWFLINSSVLILNVWTTMLWYKQQWDIKSDITKIKKLLFIVRNENLINSFWEMQKKYNDLKKNKLERKKRNKKNTI